jgi:CheY-like chemotaxis protein
MHQPVRILVVDDNPDIVDILKMRLESHGYEVVTAANFHVDAESRLRASLQAGATDAAAAPVR